MDYFRHNLKYLMKTKKISQLKIGKMAGVNQSTVVRWCSGLMTPTIKNILSLSSALNISIDDLINTDLEAQDVSKVYIKDSIKELKKDIMNLPNSEFDDNSKKALINMVDTLNELNKK